MGSAYIKGFIMIAIIIQILAAAVFTGLLFAGMRSSILFASTSYTHHKQAARLYYAAAICWTLFCFFVFLIVIV